MAAAAPTEAYPGAVATVQQLMELADEYRGAALDLLQRGRRGNASSWAPARLLAIQAIELYLNALLLSTGEDAASIRGLHHDLAKRAARAADLGLVLRTKTAAHLQQLAGRREYLTTRYGPELSGTWSQINRLTATLDEVGEKVALKMTPRKPCSAKGLPATLDA